MEPFFVSIRPQTKEELEVAIKVAREEMQKATRVLIGAGAGLSTAAGVVYDGKRFRDHFGAFIDRYGMTDMYSAGFYPFPTEEDKWAFWAHHAMVNSLDLGALDLYKEIYDWARERDYFVITTNVDLLFEKAGFDPDRIFAPQGDFEHIQCVTGQHGRRNAAELFRAIEADTEGGKRTRITDSSLVPTCDVCASPMEMHLRIDGSFVQDDEWYAAQGRYEQFVSKISSEPTLLLELGVGWNTPVWIRMPFERIAKAYGSPLIRMNYDSASVDPSIKSGIAIEGDIAETFPLIAGEQSKG